MAQSIPAQHGLVFFPDAVYITQCIGSKVTITTSCNSTQTSACWLNRWVTMPGKTIQGSSTDCEGGQGTKGPPTFSARTTKMMTLQALCIHRGSYGGISQAPQGFRLIDKPWRLDFPTMYATKAQGVSLKTELGGFWCTDDRAAITTYQQSSKSLPNEFKTAGGFCTSFASDI
jgi:hypothetical protein